MGGPFSPFFFLGGGGVEWGSIFSLLLLFLLRLRRHYCRAWRGSCRSSSMTLHSTLPVFYIRHYTTLPVFYIRHCPCFTYDTARVLHTTLAVFYIRHCLCFTYNTARVLYTTLPVFYIRHWPCFTYDTARVLHTTLPVFYICTRQTVVSQA